ncbi:hypothetical protein MKK55_04340 [Methylobacterium sp. J-059]|uniref:hypothetical protein n=1 Tax=Methylobacterium sp. J-059 TaxID=2836643 RepID=UPI001FB86C40|nr:hypothetical protein [Methylobacterium sp. J-059]MCJ2038187.1 hypothetical protein [Methylobacterium sp. J-059]
MRDGIADSGPARQERSGNTFACMRMPRLIPAPRGSSGSSETLPIIAAPGARVSRVFARDPYASAGGLGAD